MIREMREEQVANGVNFLVHPKVKTAPLSQRISFLESKVCDHGTKRPLFEVTAVMESRCAYKVDISIYLHSPSPLRQCFTLSYIIRLTSPSYGCLSVLLFREIGSDSRRDISGAFSGGGWRRGPVSLHTCLQRWLYSLSKTAVAFAWTGPLNFHASLPGYVYERRSKASLLFPSKR